MWLQWSPVKPSHPSCFQLCYPLQSKSKYCDLNFQTLQTLLPSHSTNMLLFKYIYCISSRNTPTELCPSSPYSQLTQIWLLGPLFPSFPLSSLFLLCFPRCSRQFLSLPFFRSSFACRSALCMKSWYLNFNNFPPLFHALPCPCLPLGTGRWLSFRSPASIWKLIFSKECPHLLPLEPSVPKGFSSSRTMGHDVIHWI